MAEMARFATTHWLRFPEVMTPDQLVLSGSPEGSVSWKIGPCGPVGPDGFRLPSNVWCAVGLFTERAAAAAAMERRDTFMPFLSGTTESWHQLLFPFRHHGECNHLHRDCPGAIFEAISPDPGGPLMVLTTAGYQFGPELKMERVIDFRRKVDLVNDWFRTLEGCVAAQPFTPHTKGDDGYTLSVWRDEASMLDATYRSGVHRTQMDQHKLTSLFDRSSFTRCRILESWGQWNGEDPIASEARSPVRSAGLDS